MLDFKTDAAIVLNIECVESISITPSVATIVDILGASGPWSIKERSLNGQNIVGAFSATAPILASFVILLH